jgi:hypothetical protein
MAACPRTAAAVRAAAAALLAAGGLAGCGGGDPPAPPAERAGPAPTPAGPADPAAVRVIRTWVRELREGDVAAAARTFADGALVQNATPVLRLGSFAERKAFLDAAFPCGARVADARAARRGFTVVRFTLTQRVGGSCPGPGGGSAYAAIRVQGGKIREWYRLPDAGAPRAPEPPDAVPAPPRDVAPLV